MNESASTSRASQLFSLIRVLAMSEFRLRFAGSVLGYLWSLGKPLMLFTVLYVVFSQMLRLGAGQPDYPLFLLLAVIMWGFFAEATGTAVRVLVSNADILRKVSFPHMALPVASSLTSVLILLLNLIVFAAFLLGTGHAPQLSWLWFPVLVLQLYVLTLGMGLLLSSLFVRFRDVGQIWDVFAQALFYATPIIYTLQLVPASAERALLANPIAQIVVHARYVMVGPSDGLGPLDGWFVLVPIGVTITIFVVGVLVFRGTSRTMVERL